MKTPIFIIFLLFTSLFLYSQKFEAGIRGGMNFTENSEIKADNFTISDLQSRFQGEKNAYHVGFYAKLALIGFYIRPELNYSHYKSNYLDALGNDFYLSSSRLGVPLLIGFQPIKSVFLHGGLVTLFYFDDENSLKNVDTIKQEDLKFGLQAGVGLSLSKLSVETRYEYPFSERSIEFTAPDGSYQIKTNPAQVTLSLGYSF